MGSQMFFRGLGFWHLCVISLLELLMFHNLKNPKGLWDAVQTFRGEHLGSRMLLPSMTNNNPSAAQRDVSRAPWSLLHLLLFTARLCSPCSISSDTTSIPPSPAKGGRRGRRDQGRHSLMQCVFGCAIFFRFFFILSQWRRRSGAPTKQRSRAWNHLSSALKGLHGFLMISPYLYISTQRLHSF